MKHIKFPTKAIIVTVLSLMGIVVLYSCLWIGMQIAGGIILGIGMSSGESLLHSHPNPNDTMTVHVVSDGCGITCDCTTRIDIAYIQRTKKGAYRVNACDVEIQWLDNYRFTVIDKLGETVVLDARDFFKEP